MAAIEIWPGCQMLTSYSPTNNVTCQTRSQYIASFVEEPCGTKNTERNIICQNIFVSYKN